MAHHTTEPRAGRIAIWRFNWSLMSALKRRAILSLCVLVAAMGGAGALDLVANLGRVHRGVVVQGVPLGGLTPASARATLAPVAQAITKRPVVAVLDGQRQTVWPGQVAYEIDVDATVDRAYRVGRTGFPLWAIAQRARGWVSQVSVEPVQRHDPRRLRLRVAGIAKAVDRLAADARVIDIDGHPAAVPAADGVIVQQVAARQALLDAFGSVSAREFTVPVQTTAPRIGTEAARAAAAQLEIAIATPIELDFKNRTWIVKAPIIRRWMRVTPQATSSKLDSPLTLVVAPVAERVKATIARITAPLVKLAVDARFEVDGRTVRVIPSKTGLAVDTKAALDLITRLLAEPVGQRRVALVLHAVDPKLTTAAAKEMGIRQRISTYTTQYSSSATSRVNNIHLLAKALDNTLVRPDDQFSFNRTIGPRTAAKGYQEAPVIVGGKLVPGLGGGICQVGTTIFNTVFFSGLPVTSRRNHSFYISHYPDGRDATVSWDGPDFRFANDSGAWVLIKTFYSSDTITISLYGTSPGYRVAYKTGAWTNRVAYPVSQTQDASLPVGTTIVEDVGIGGHDVVVTRTVTRKDKVVRQDTFESHYSPKEQVVRVGTKQPVVPKPAPKPKPKPKPPTPTPPSTPTPSPSSTPGR